MERKHLEPKRKKNVFEEMLRDSALVVIMFNVLLSGKITSYNSCSILLSPVAFDDTQIDHVALICSVSGCVVFVGVQVKL